VRILYLSLSYVPSRRASSVQVMKMCAALARRGHEVSLVAKAGSENSDADDHSFYKVEPSFSIAKVARPAWKGGGVLYAAGVAAKVARRRRWLDIVYARDPLGAIIAAEAGLPVVYEAHGVPGSRMGRAVLARTLSRENSVGLVAITDALRRDLAAADVVPPDRRVVVAPDASDPPSALVTRRRPGAPPVIGYVGSLYAGRGIETIIALARAMPGCRFQLVGGTDADVARWRSTGLPDNLALLGFRTQAELPALYAGFDVVLMPHAASGVVGATGKSDISRWTSPMKMFEYMASGVALVASDLPVLQEVLRDGDNAMVVPSEDLAAWRTAIERVLGDDDLRFRLARTAQADLARSYTWDARARAVMTGLGLESVSS
jgi:glycosyltransferase involved in cell wall biosynthesis